MRILVADHDAKMVAAIARALAGEFTIDAATSKLSCLAMLDVSEYHLIICCERLEDGSGLELLSQAGKRWPEVLRVLAIEPDRLPLLAGRLKPFRLFETVPYPLHPDKLRSVLMLVQAAENAHVDTMNVQHIVLEDEMGGAAEQPVVAAAARAGGGRAPAPRAPNVAPAARRASAAPAQRTPAPTAAPAARAPARTSAAPVARSAASQFAGPAPAHPRPAIPGAANRRLGDRRDGGERRGTISVSAAEADSILAGESLAEASQIAASLRPRLETAPNLFGTRRTLFIAAGVGVAAVAAAAMMFSGEDSPGAAATPTLTTVQSLPPLDAASAASTESASPPASLPLVSDAPAGASVPGFGAGRATSEPPEVLAFVADIESALTVDNFDRARSLLDSLRGIAPDHPRLALFEALVTRGEELQALTAAEDDVPEPPRQRANRVQGEVARAAAGNATRVGDPLQRRQAALRALAPPAPTPAPKRAASLVAPPATPVASNTFSGKTLEDSTRVAPPSGSAQPEAPAEQALRPRALVLPVVKEAKVVRQVEPEYPREAMREGVEGSIDLRFTVTAAGKVADIEVVTANPPQTFDRAAISALRRWRYEPRREDGVAVDSRTRVRLEFKIAGDARRR